MNFGYRYMPCNSDGCSRGSIDEEEKYDVSDQEGYDSEADLQELEESLYYQIHFEPNNLQPPALDDGEFEYCVEEDRSSTNCNVPASWSLSESAENNLKNKRRSGDVDDADNISRKKMKRLMKKAPGGSTSTVLGNSFQDGVKATSKTLDQHMQVIAKTVQKNAGSIKRNRSVSPSTVITDTSSESDDECIIITDAVTCGKVSNNGMQKKETKGCKSNKSMKKLKKASQPVDRRIASDSSVDKFCIDNSSSSDSGNDNHNDDISINFVGHDKVTTSTTSERNLQDILNSLPGKHVHKFCFYEILS